MTTSFGSGIARQAGVLARFTCPAKSLAMPTFGRAGTEARLCLDLKLISAINPAGLIGRYEDV